MGTLADLKARILDEIGGEVSVRQIGAAIKRAIDHYAAERFWFNVERGTTFTVCLPQVEVPAEVARLPLDATLQADFQRNR